MTLSAGVDVSGPIVRTNPGKVMLANIERFVGKLADEGAESARSRLRSGEGGRQPLAVLRDRASDHVIGRTMARPSKGGRRWHVYGVVQLYNEGLSAAGGRSLMAAGSILEGRLNVFRSVTRDLGRKIRQVDLTKGLE